MTAAVPPDPQRPYHLLRTLVGPFAAPIYGWGVARRNARFDRHEGVRRVPLPVISVGNLTVGGTGKTPFVTWLCRQLAQRGFKPAIAMRGYRAELNNGRSDEAQEYRAAMPSVPVIVNADRHAGITQFLQDGGQADLVVLDDGFQHRFLHRDLDIVLVDTRRPLTRERLLPWGDLREPALSLRRAGVVIGMHWDGRADFVNGVTPFIRAPFLSTAQHHWNDVAVDRHGKQTVEPVEWLRQKRVVALCGIARPEVFLRRLDEAGCTRAATLVLRDHEPFTPILVERVAGLIADAGADAVVMTQKDFARLERVPEPWRALTVARPRLDIVVHRADAFIQCVTNAVDAARGDRNPTMVR